MPVPRVGVHQCDQCTLCFASPQALATHKFRVHSYLSDAVVYASDHNVCQCCMTWFCSSTRLAAHYKRVAACLRAVVGFFARPAVASVAERDARTERFRRLRAIGRDFTFADQPRTRIFGPSIRPGVES